MAQLEVGDRAPEFTATAHDGSTVRLEDFLGRSAVVLFFYPRDASPICTKEACAFRDSYEVFQEAGAEVIGVSSDSTSSHQRFAGRHALPFKLISDEDGSLRRAFGVPRHLGLLPGRVTYVIDRDGLIKLIFCAHIASQEHVDQALAAVRG